jgi:hypothetical protein
LFRKLGKHVRRVDDLDEAIAFYRDNLVSPARVRGPFDNELVIFDQSKGPLVIDRDSACGHASNPVQFVAQSAISLSCSWLDRWRPPG